ncbi:MAG: rRNA maturation RNase YbeY [Actinomycetales bacterium]|nr:rRNA maturation RNase YbeY [Actinomycetales bacterium]
MAIDISNESGTDINELELIYQSEFILRKLHINPAAELSILLVDEVEMAVLHEKYMDEPGSTDVLSFPMDELRAGVPGQESDEGMLGDIVLCPDVAARQAEIAGHSFESELRLLLTHGILHLLGHDHAEPEEHKVMFSLQAQLLAQWEGERNSRGLSS